MTMPSRRGLPGAGDDPYAERRARIPLVEALSFAFPDQEIITAFVARSGLRGDLIRTDASSVGRWTAVVDRAVYEDRIVDLLNEALKVSNNLELVAAAHHYLEVRKSLANRRQLLIQEVSAKQALTVLVIPRRT
jgi:hypothetical protein